MAGENTYAVLDSLFKTKYADKLENAIPELTYVQSRVPFYDSKKLGATYKQPVILGREHGVTRIKKGDGVITLASPSATTIKTAEAEGYQLIMRGQLEYGPLFASQNKEAAFENSFGVLIANLLDSARHTLEIEMIHGQSIEGIGKLDSTHTTNSTTLKIDPAHWAPGIFNGMEGRKIVIYTAGATYTWQSIATIDAVDPDASPPTLTVTYNTTADSLAGDYIFLFGDFGQSGAGIDAAGTIDIKTDRSKWKTGAGLDAIATNGSGGNNPASIYTISGSTYQLFRSVIQSAGSLDLSFDTLLRGWAKIAVKGATGEYMTLVSPLTFANLMADQGALRRYDKADSPARYEVGAKSIVFYTQAGSMEVLGHSLVKQGQTFSFAPRLFKRVGTTDITFDTAKMDGISSNLSQFFLPVSDKNAVEMRCYSEQQLFTAYPSRLLKVKDIVNTT